MRQIDVVIEAVLDRRPGGELRLRPDAQDGRGQHMRGGMAEPLEVGHLGALLEGFAFVGHWSGQLSIRGAKGNADFPCGRRTGPPGGTKESYRSGEGTRAASRLHPILKIGGLATFAEDFDFLSGFL